ncbi:type VII secretion-associated serine protease mycosin [Krasilnikovia sp. MM14-A1259]|uniref:type VII secretion-associated serine protease mycosin n=1 Tax=Krasilnikovia sp. MM14-A1259 TaxID=3373539 RepID=UPI0037FA94D8
MSRRLTAVAAVLLTIVGSATLTTPARADSVRNHQWHLDFLRISDAHRISTGLGVTVAVIDSGVADHTDLSGSILHGKDFVSPGGDGQADVDGHGTGMAGIIAAHGKDGSGALGIAPDAKILPVRVASTGSFKRDLAPAILWSVNHGADVINISIGGGISAATLNALETAARANVVVIASAGNRPEASGVTAPAFVPSVVAVGAVARTGERASVSVTGPALDLMAPGTDILTTRPNNQYGTGTGTSDAAAIVSGVAALIRSRFPRLTAHEVVARMESTAIDEGDSGVDPEYGHGVINVVAALSANSSVPPDQSSGPPPSIENTSRADNHAVPNSSAPGKSSLLFVSTTVLALLIGTIAFFSLRRRRGSDEHRSMER